MSNRDAYAPGVPSWVATVQPDPPAAARFYAGVFGWDLEPREDYVIARLRGRDVAAIAPLPPGMEPAPPAAWVTHVEVESAEATADRVRAAGGQVVTGPMDTPMGRIAVVADPTGGLLVAKEPDRHPGAGIVNAFGAYAMSRLDTPDPDAVAPFYGDVFGWTTEPLEMGGATVWMFRLPGYEGGLPEQPVSRETVAVLAPAPEGAGAAWAVDFWVEDVDAAAAAATDGGGTAVVAPFDMPLGRQAVLADPAGATFSVTRVAQAG